MRVLGIDASTVVCGFAVMDAGGKLIDSFSIDVHRETTHRERRARVAERVVAVVKQREPDFILLERIRLFHRGVIKFETIQRLCGMWTAIADASPLVSYTVDTQTWRRLVVGDSRAKKDDVVAWVLKKYGVQVKHDEADAIGIARCGLLYNDRRFARYFKPLD